MRSQVLDRHFPSLADVELLFTGDGHPGLFTRKKGEIFVRSNTSNKYEVRFNDNLRSRWEKDDKRMSAEGVDKKFFVW